MADTGRRHHRAQGAFASNINSVAEVERAFEDTRTASEYVTDAIADFSGTVIFVVVHVIFFTAWFVINTYKIPGIPLFDPYPFVLLSLVVSVEAVLLSTFVLMKQNRMQRKTDHRDHLNLQIDLLAEKEVTKMLQLLRLVCIKLEVKEAMQDEELDEMIRTTSVDHLAQSIRDAMPPSV